MLNPDYREILSALFEEKVEFVLVGAYAMAIHGFPRATGDIDIFVNPDSKNALRLFNALAKFGAPLREIQVVDFSKEDVIFQIGVAPRRIDIITSIDAVSFESAWKDKIIVEIDDLKIPVLSLEKMIVNKESTGRKKDALDAETLRGNSGS
jgi:hypothetical protein